MGQLTISMAMFNSFLYVYQRVSSSKLPKGFPLKEYGYPNRSAHRSLPPEKAGNFYTWAMGLAKLVSTWVI